MEPLAHVGIEVQADAVALEVRPDEDPVLLHVVAAEQIPYALVPAGQRQAFARLRGGDAGRGRTRSEHHAGVVIRRRGSDLRRRVGQPAGVPRGVPDGLVAQLPVLRAVQDRDHLRDALEAVTRLHSEVALARRATFGGDQYHAVGPARPVDRLRGRILEDVDRFDLVRVD